jgi:phospholipase C
MIGGNTVLYIIKACNKLVKYIVQNLVRFLGTPFQKLFDRAGDTHTFLNDQAITILKNDGYTNASEFFAEFKQIIVEGNLWADKLWKNAFHHYNPRNKRGLLIWPSGTDQCNIWFNDSLAQWKKGRLSKSMFLLGAAIHIVQDLCQPYHANCKVFDGHQKYEQWVDARKHRFAVNDRGIYGISDKPAGWVIENARYSARCISSVSRSGEDAEKVSATKALLARAQRTTAGFLMFFLEQAQYIGLPNSKLLDDPDFFQKALSSAAAD